eukprot:TRINITY_DN8356_c0_g1_i2.p1 TRINITY_DN8356_c0_g1~~TRINITY_DN8356_c0_g1_i2.p1  ORF type:complete len:150 (+),score=55.60 TRINITY_DN8356_c0_g1_i2:91-540(+)
MAAVAESHKTAFAVFDKKADGVLDQDEIAAAMATVGETATDSTLTFLASQSLTAGGKFENGLDVESFADLVKTFGPRTEGKALLELAGSCFFAGDGVDEKLDATAVAAGLDKFGLSATAEEAAEMIKDFDSDRDGKLSREEFAGFLGSF